MPIDTANNDPIGFGNLDQKKPVRLVQPKAGADFEGITQSEAIDFRIGQDTDVSDLANRYNRVGGAGAAADAAARKRLQDRLKFGLERFGLEREVNQLDRRDAIEGAVSNALQRGIFRSGIRIKNVERAKERPALQGKGINLSEKELRADIENALASLRANANAARASSDLRRDQALEQLRRQQQQDFAEYVGGGIFDDTPYYEPYTPIRGNQR